jgi:NDP-sugar pyrophosphorylase family protein
LGEQIKAVFGKSYAGMGLVYSQESSPLGTAGALRLALPLFKSDFVLVMNGDSFYDTDLKSFSSWHCERGAEATLLLTEAPSTEQYGQVHIDVNGCVIRFNEKGEGKGPGFISVGIYLLKQHLLLSIPINRTVSLEREMFPAWVGQGLYGYQSKGRFLDIGTPEAYAASEQFFQEASP